MKIEQRKDGLGRARQLREDLCEILRSDADGMPVCAPNCPKADPDQCSRHCPDIPRFLSSDPESYPLESRIAPLVYELKRLEVFQPCWSCEGHNGPDGGLWKIPRVWFYCRSVVHLRVLADSIKELHVNSRLSVPWRLVLTFSDPDNADTTISLEPSVEDNRSELSALQHDIDTLAECLHDLVFDEARKLSRAAR